MASTFLNLSTDTTLGGNSPSDSVAVSQKAIKSYVDNNSGGSYTAGTGIDITNGTISVTSPVLTNTATGSGGLSVLGTSSSSSNATNVGYDSEASAQGATAYGDGGVARALHSTAIGYGARIAGYGASCSVALGSGAIIPSSVTKPTHQIGRGTNSEEYTLYVGFGDSDASTDNPNYKLLDGTTGYIPNARINMDSTPTSSSTNTVTSGGVYTALNGKQNTLTAGTGIDITSNTISVDGETTSEVTLATVATSGSYNDLSNKPTIPTVNNATLTITQGGVSKGTFTANASSDVTIALDAGGGGGAVDSVNGYTGIVVLTAGDVGVEAFTAAEVQTIWESV